MEEKKTEDVKYDEWAACPDYEAEYERLMKENFLLSDELEKLRRVHIETVTRLLDEINDLRLNSYKRR